MEQAQETVNELRVSGKTDTRSLGWSIYAAVKEGGKTVELAAIGVDAVNSAVKAVVVANQHLAPIGQHVVIDPYFSVVGAEDKPRSELTVIRLRLLPRILR